MDIRFAESADLDEIIDLLRVSLGESLLPKSVAYWRWKHIDNPFGPSPVLVATERGRIVGVRAFMQWRWRMGGQTLKAVRAVDTATHPDHQGKGIFRKLTLRMLDECRERGIGFVFNTPNKRSGPGYLKMGWSKAGRLPIHVAVRRPLSMLAHALKLRETKTDDQPTVSFKEVISQWPGFDRSAVQPFIYTDYSKEYLIWRYADVPLISYRVNRLMVDNKGGALFIYRLKPSRFGVEMRITDFFCRPDAMRDAINLVRDTARAHGAHFITASGLYRDWDYGGFLQLHASGGPLVTVRPLNADVDMLVGFSRWSPSIGDLELF